MTSKFERPVKPKTGIFNKRDQVARKPQSDQNVVSVFSEQTMEDKYNLISQGYVDEYVKAGFPPKVCAQLVASLCSFNRIETQILDIGCGQGFGGKFLWELGFKKIVGIDCSKGLLESA